MDAWALVPTHLNLSVPTGTRPLARRLKRLLTSYVVKCNRRHRRTAHLFQDRYKSIVIEIYLKAL